MTNVIHMRRRDAKPSETMTLLTELMELEKRGELHGFMPITDAGGETRFRVFGTFAGRLQFAGYTLIKSLNALSDRVSQSGSAGNTAVSGMSETFTSPHRRPHKSLRQSTALGDL